MPESLFLAGPKVNVGSWVLATAIVNAVVLQVSAAGACGREIAFSKPEEPQAPVGGHDTFLRWAQNGVQYRRRAGTRSWEEAEQAKRRDNALFIRFKRVRDCCGVKLRT